MAYRKQNCFNMGCPERGHNNKGGPTCIYRAKLMWCHSPEHRDSWLFALYYNVVARQFRKRDQEMSIVICPTCGRSWEGTVARLCQARVATERHIEVCRTRTPAERRKANHKLEIEWLRKPPKSTKITNNPGHEGLKDKRAVFQALRAVERIYRA